MKRLLIIAVFGLFSLTTQAQCSGGDHLHGYTVSYVGDGYWEVHTWDNRNFTGGTDAYWRTTNPSAACERLSQQFTALKISVPKQQPKHIFRVDMGCSPWYDDPNNPSCKWRECNGQIERDCLD